MKPYASLVRVSTKSQASDKKHGIPNQLAANKALAERLNVTIKQEYVDAISGMSESREAFFRLLSEAENYEGVIIYDLSRLARSEEISHKFLRLLQEAGLIVYAANRGLEPLVADFRTAIDIALSAEERRNLLRRTQSGLIAEAEKGKLPNGIHLFGLTNVPGRNEAIINPLEAKVIREVYALAVQKLSYRAIAKEMMKRGRLTMKGSTTWFQHTVRRVIVNPAYKGEFIWNWKGERTYTLAIPAIVDSDTWQRAQRGKRGAYPTLGFPLTGHVKCAICGYSLSARRVGQKFPYYRCNSHKEPRGKCGLPHIRREKLEKAVEDKLRALLASPKKLEGMLLKSVPKTLDNATQQKINSLKQEETRIAEMAQRGIVTLDKAEELVKDVRKKIKALDVLPEAKVNVKEYLVGAEGLNFKELLEYCKVVAYVGIGSVDIKFGK